MNEEDEGLNEAEISALSVSDSLPPSVEERTVARLRTMGILRAPRRAFVVRPVAGFLALCGSFLLGLLVTSLLRPVHTPDARREYLLLFYDQPEGAPDPRLAKEYHAWGRGLDRQGGLLLQDGALTDEVKRIQPTAGTAVLNTGTEPNGFMVFKATDGAEALKLAKTCPHLSLGGRLELRTIKNGTEP